MTTLIINLKQAKDLNNCVMAYGHFTTIHPGHIRYLRHAREQGDKLIVALIGNTLNEEGKAYHFDQKERAEALALLDIAHAIVLLNNNELTQAIKIIRPALLVLGREHKERPTSEINKAIKVLESTGKKILFHAGEIHYASTELLSRSERELSKERRAQFKLTCERQGLNLPKLIESMESWKSASLIVLGDTIVDQYAACEAIGMSAEAPVVVVKELERKNFIGGAAIVASHISALGAKCELISVIGSDSTGTIVKEELIKRAIIDGLVIDKSRPTTFKKRYVVDNQKLFRVSRLEDHALDSKIEAEIIEKLKRSASKAQGIVISDFVYGVVTDKVLDAIQELSQKYGLMLFGDLQCSSQLGMVTRFKNFALLCPNEREARLALQEKHKGLELLSQDLLKKTAAERLVMKLGAEGFIAYDRSNSLKEKKQAFPALSVNPLDVTGAGDSLLAVLSTGISSGQPMMATAAIGCCMAALAVESMGNAPIELNALKKNLIEVMQ